ncbi:unnamed protein product [Adineta ricciae]|uniref:Uncharacterized protein n=1 Tax=Adineta ricciae TaxID=249248 RepID=A0A814XAP1_ADIRI|nr:unnamed protein product [Adineta ricciae]CAF1215304.1 unnamed protein product [Adineta ricciae]
MEYLKQLPFSSLTGALQYQTRTKPNKTAVLYPDPKSNWKEYSTLTYKQYDNVTNHLAGIISKYLPSLSSSNETITCGLLAADNIKYLLSEYALLKLPNVIMFPISSRNSQAAVEHLLKETKTILLLTTSQYSSMMEMVRQKEEFQHLKVLLLDNDEFDLEQIMAKKDIECKMTFKSVSIGEKNDEELNKKVVIIHSSGSTAYPKPVYLTNRYFLISSTVYQSINTDFWREDDIVLAWGALFHALAFIATTRAIISGCTFALPLCVGFPPKPNELLHNLQVKNGITVLITVPSLLEQLVQEILSGKNHSVNFKPLANLRAVAYGGASCPDELCQILVDNGVVLLNVYGSTETGLLLSKNFNPYDKRWKYVEIADSRKPYVRIETAPNTENPNEKILIHQPDDPYLAENVCNYADGCYTAGDIFLEDPPNSGQYLILGRQDDTLVHVNGEKTNALAMEDSIRSSPLIKQVAIVGHNQFCAAALIQLDIEEAFNYEFDEIEEKVWKVVEQANSKAPSHSHILRQLVKIIPMNKSLPATHKGNIMRQKVNQEYSTLIKKIYEKFFNQQSETTRHQSVWTKETIKKYLEDKLSSFVHEDDRTKIKNSSRSIFDFGINSLQVIQLRNSICQDIHEISKNFIYEYSSIDQMIEELMKHFKSENVNDQCDDPYHYQLTEQIIDKYIHLMKTTEVPHPLKENQGKERVFLITGANGSLGNFVIRDLLRQSESIVKRVFCLLRGSNTQQRLFESFEQRQLDVSILKDSLEQRLIILPSSMNLSDEHLGQTEDIYQQLQNEVTDIIHVAWKMNFNQTIKDFEQDSIFGVYNLLRLASSNQMQFHFISSIASAGSGLLSTIKEEPLPRMAQVALPQGYGQSKYAAEHLCWAAMNLWHIPVNIYRVGQISGDTQNGVWNTGEMTSMMIYAGAGLLKKMPNVGEDVNWIPVDICSASLVDLALKSSFQTTISDNERVYHLLNPFLITYDEYLTSLRAAGLTFDTVPPKSFINAISALANTTNPLVKLLPFFEQSFSEKGILKLSKYETTKTTGKCEILRNCSPIDSNLIELYLNYWKKCQVLQY